MRAELRDDDPRRVAPAASFAPKSRRESRFTRFRAHGALLRPGDHQGWVVG